VAVIVAGVESRIGDPELHELTELPLRHRTVTLPAATWKQAVARLFTGVGNPFFQAPSRSLWKERIGGLMSYGPNLAEQYR
jgi:hypothetical protein